jgi:NhaP-type Na+/H+ or K+/H+ antiporter
MPYLKVHGGIEWLIATILGRTASAIIIFLYADALAGLFLNNDYTTICGIIILRILLGVLLGLVLAFPQYLVLRHRSGKAPFWLLANGSVSGVTTYITVLTVGIPYGLITGAVTGYALVDILRNPTRRAEWRVRERTVT